MIWWTVENKISDPTDFVPANRDEEVEGKRDEQTREGRIREGEPPKELEPLADEQE